MVLVTMVLVTIPPCHHTSSLYDFLIYLTLTTYLLISLLRDNVWCLRIDITNIKDKQGGIVTNTINILDNSRQTQKPSDRISSHGVGNNGVGNNTTIPPYTPHPHRQALSLSYCWRVGHAMDGDIYWLMDGHTEVHMNVWTYERMNVWTYERMNVWTYERMNVWTYERMYGCRDVGMYTIPNHKPKTTNLKLHTSQQIKQQINKHISPY